MEPGGEDSCDITVCGAGGINLSFKHPLVLAEILTANISGVIRARDIIFSKLPWAARLCPSSVAAAR